MLVQMTFREALAKSERPLAGMWVCSGSSVAADICAGAGLDWLLIDMEHSANGLGTVLHQLQVAAAYPVVSVVRVPTNDPVIIKQVLDLGAQNVLVPMVSTPEQARAAVEAVHYPPRGQRGVGSALARSARWNRIPGYLVEAESHVSLFIQVETAAGVEAAGEIASIDGIDGVFVGPSDLAASMGHLGKQDHQDVVEAVRRPFEAVREAGKPVGVNAFDHDLAEAYLADGARFILVGADVAVLARGSEALAARFVPDSRDPAKASY